MATEETIELLRNVCSCLEYWNHSLEQVPKQLS